MRRREPVERQQGRVPLADGAAEATPEQAEEIPTLPRTPTAAPKPAP